MAPSAEHAKADQLLLGAEESTQVEASFVEYQMTCWPSAMILEPFVEQATEPQPFVGAIVKLQFVPELTDAKMPPLAVVATMNVPSAEHPTLAQAFVGANVGVQFWEKAGCATFKRKAAKMLAPKK